MCRRRCAVRNVQAAAWSVQWARCRQQNAACNLQCAMCRQACAGGCALAAAGRRLRAAPSCSGQRAGGQCAACSAAVRCSAQVQRHPPSGSRDTAHSLGQTLHMPAAPAAWWDSCHGYAQPAASWEGTRWWPPLVTAAAGGTLCAGRTSQHPGEHQSQQGPRAAAKAANACPGASASARTGAECHRRPVWPPQVPSYLDAFRASVQGMRPAACALPASRAAGRRHAARAAQAAAVTTCAGRGDAVRAPSPTAGQADTVAWPCPAKATAMSQCVPFPGTGRVPAVRAHCTCKGFPQHPDLLRGSRSG